MPGAHSRITDTERVSAPERPEIEGVAHEDLGAARWPDRGTTQNDPPLVHPGSKKPKPHRVRDNSPGPSPLELSSLTDWAIQTEAALSADFPPVRPAGGPRRPASRSDWDRNRPDHRQAKTPGPATDRSSPEPTPPSEDVLGELHEIHQSLQRRGSAAPRSKKRPLP
jgi:hypothetical protein